MDKRGTRFGCKVRRGDGITPTPVDPHPGSIPMSGTPKQSPAAAVAVTAAAHLGTV